MNINGIGTFLLDAIRIDDSAGKWRRFLGIGLLVGAVAIALFSSGDKHLVGASLILCGASIFSGILLGFLFGIPKTSRRKVDSTSNAALVDTDYQPNTNLEDISDWLTKMLVGIGLVELKNVPSYVDSIAGYWQGCFGATCPRAYASGLIVFMSIMGFLLGYLWTRLALITDFIDKDPRRILGQLVNRVARAAGGSRRRNAVEVSTEEIEAARTIEAFATQHGLAIEDLKQQLNALAHEYELVASSPSSRAEKGQRTREIVVRMQTLAFAAYPLLPELINSNSRGMRLAAIAILQMKPDSTYLPWLVDRQREDFPEIGYESAVALARASRTVTHETREDMATSLQQALHLVPDMPETADRRSILEKALADLGAA